MKSRFLYCGRVYLREVFREDRPDSEVSSAYPASSVRATSARAVWQRVQKVLWLQWRSITIIVFLLVDIVFLAIVWVQLDNAIGAAKAGKLEHFLPFLTCLAANASMKGKCFHYGQDALVSEGTAIASLMLLSVGYPYDFRQITRDANLWQLTGVQTGLMMSRTSMFVGWYELFMAKFGGKREFVSLDAKRYSQDARTFELIKAGGSPRTALTDTPDSPDLDKPEAAVYATYGPPGSAYPERAYKQNTMSFSGPRSPSSQGNATTDWKSAEEAFTRGGLRSHPPSPSMPGSPPRGNPHSPPLPPPPMPSKTPKDG